MGVILSLVVLLGFAWPFALLRTAYRYGRYHGIRKGFDAGFKCRKEVSWGKGYGMSDAFAKEIVTQVLQDTLRAPDDDGRRPWQWRR